MRIIGRRCSQLRYVSLLFKFQFNFLILLQKCKVFFAFLSNFLDFRIDLLIDALIFEDVRLGHVDFAERFFIWIAIFKLIILNLTLFVVYALKLLLQKLHLVIYARQLLLLFKGSFVASIQILNVQAQLVLLFLLLGQPYLQLLNLFI